MLEKRKFRMPKTNPEDLFLFCKEVGYCLMQIQSFELTVEIYLAQVHNLDVDMDRVEAEKIFDQCGKMTLGQLFNEIEQKEKLPIELSNRISNFIKERNWLVHKCRKENEGYLYNSEKFPKTLDRIRNLYEESDSLNKYFSTKSTEYILTKGILSKEQLYAYTQNIIDSFSED